MIKAALSIRNWSCN